MKNKLFDLSRKYHYIIDTSYIVYCAASSAFKNYAYQNDVLKSDLGPEFDPTLDPEFNVILEEKFRSKIVSPIKEQVLFLYDKSKFIFTIDCPRSEIWRRDFYPEYKMNRDANTHEKDPFNLGKVFKYVYDNIIPSFCDETGSIMVRSSCAESDDIIAVLAEKLYNEDKNNYVIILSSDRDMVQLYNDRTMILAGHNEIRDPKREIQILTRTDNIEEDIDAGDFLLFKILIGDGSDNIPSVKPRLGPKTALKYILDKSKKELKNLLKEDVNILNSFKRNKQMISMKEIPDYVKNTILENIETSFREQKQPKEEAIPEASSNELLSDIL